MASSRIRSGVAGSDLPEGGSPEADVPEFEARGVDLADVLPEGVDLAGGVDRAGADLPECAFARVILSRKELARHYRQQAYQKAKAWRAQDPKHLAMKEAVKVRRRAAYQDIKARRKAAESQEKSARTAKQVEARQAARKELGSKLRGELKGARQTPVGQFAEGRSSARRSHGHASEYTPPPSLEHPGKYPAIHSESDAEGDGQSDDAVDRQSELRNQQRELQSELQSALKNKRVSELMQRVRRATEDVSLVANTVTDDNFIED